jgi:signal transduction histidine kinase/CheY-like chemotaxis protein
VTPPLLSLAITYENDVVLARQHARFIAERLGFDVQDQTRLATAVSEVARNAFTYAGRGQVEFQIEGATAPQVLLVRITDRGPGIADVGAILEGRYRSSTGMGLGIAGARRLVDQFDIDSVPGQGTTVVLKKLLPRRVGLLGPQAIARLGEELVRARPRDPVEEIRLQNRELLRALEELARRQEELTALNRELEDTNRGVVALYAELDEKADHLRRADEIKSRFLSNMSHEFRTPVNSIQALARLLLERTDGDLSPEQEKQITFIRRAADDLAELVNDLLDLAKVEAGKIAVRPVEFEVRNLFGALRGMLRPLLVNESVNLVFDEPDDLPPLYTDEAKVSQILRNFISNALKFTERGEVHVTARLVPGADEVAFSVADTGIGIAPEDHERIFHEFAQVDSPLQRRVKGTGLGLPLCRRLAGLLGGTVTVESQPGLGSTFTAVIPLMYGPALGDIAWEADPGRMPVLVVEDSAETILVYEKFLNGAGFQVLPARSVREAHAALERVPDTRDVPVVVVTTVEDRQKGLALGADAYCVKPIDRRGFLQTLTGLVAPPSVRRILVVDDEEISRYLLRQHLTAPHHQIIEAATGAEAIRLAQSDPPDVVCLDLGMPDLDGVAVLERLKAHPATRDVPVVVVTARVLDEPERRDLMRFAAAVLSKSGLSRESAMATVEEAMRTASQAA